MIYQVQGRRKTTSLCRTSESFEEEHCSVSADLLLFAIKRVKKLAFGSKFRKGSTTSKLAIFGIIGILGVISIALLAQSAAFTNNPFSPYSTYTTTVSGSTYTITQQPTLTVSTTVTGSGGQQIPATITGNITGSQISSIAVSTTTSTACAFSCFPVGAPVPVISFTLTGQTGSHVTPTICVPLASVGYGIPNVLVNGKSPDSQSYTISGNQVCVTFTTHFSTDSIQISYFTAYVTVSATSVYQKSVAVSGSVVPNPGANQEVSVAVTAPNGATVLNGVVPVNSTTGAYTYTAVPGGSSNWVNGTYVAQVTWGTLSQTYTNATSFTYGTVPTTTTSSSSSGSSTSSSKSVTFIASSTTTTVATTTTQTVATTYVTTLVNPGTTIVTTITQGGHTIVTTQSTVTTVQGSGSVTAEAIAAVGVVLAIIAGAIALMAMRRR